MSHLNAVLAQAGRNFRKTWGSQLLTLLSVSIAILIFVFFLLVYFNLLRAGRSLGEELRLIAFLDQSVAPEVQDQLKKRISDSGQVEKIVYVSREEAFARLSRQLGSERDILAGLDPSFLPASLEIYPAKGLSGWAQMRGFADHVSHLPGVQKVQYGEEWLERFGSFTQLMKIVVLASGSLLILTTVFLVSHTIRLTLVARKEELELLRLLGADNSYIRGPLLVEGFLLGLLSAAIGLSCLFVFFHWIKSRFPGPDGFELTFFSPAVLIVILLASVLLCTAGSLISTRKLLRI